MTKMKEILIPIAVVAVGVLGAFATQMPERSSSDSAAQVLGPAWIDNIQPCQEPPYVCATTGSEVCTVMIDGVKHELKGKNNPLDNFCPRTMYKVGL